MRRTSLNCDLESNQNSYPKCSSAERTFSTSVSTVTTKRTKLDPVNVNMLVYVRENMSKIKLDKLVWENEDEERLEKECNSE